VTTSIKLAEALWAGDLEYDSTNQAIWATGEYPPDDDPRIQRVFDLDDQLKDIRAELERRAGPTANRSLPRLSRDADRWPDSAERIHAAAVLRVLTSDTYLDATEALQPGDELPAVGVYAEED